ncbi:hypothetical protein [Acidocella facilis]|uniref:hypothetical protein n=1 Tax=Acidocella facilis TaxID=525 RepID=UPI001F1A6CD4|nr:hypothetical protein [Acidocella facilis]
MLAGIGARTAVPHGQQQVDDEPLEEGQSGDFNLNLNLQKGGAQSYQSYVGALNKQAEEIQVRKAIAMARALAPQQIQTLISSGQAAEALQVLKGTLMLHPKSGVAWYLAAEAEDASGNESAAGLALSKANQYAPGLPFADPRKAAALREHIGTAGCCAGQ